MNFWQTYSVSQLASLVLFAAAAALAMWFAVRSVWPAVQRWRQQRRSVADTVWMAQRDSTLHTHASMHASGTPGKAQASRRTATRVLSDGEREAYLLLCSAMPGRIVLAHVPLSRFVRLPSNQARRDWMQRVGALQVDLLLCDTQSRVLAVVAVRARLERASSQRRHERLAQELRACGIPLQVWHEGAMPTVAGVRSLLAPAVGVKTAPVQTQSLIPVAETRETASEFGFSTFEAQDDVGAEPVRSQFEDTVAGPPAVARGAKAAAGFRKKAARRSWAA
jgi:hypothetical protein